MTTQLPAETHLTDVAGTQVAWTELGTGEDLVLLHGLGDCNRTWRRVAPALAQRYHVLMPDLPGHGRSGRPDAPYSLAWFAGMISDWMSEIGVPHAHLVGHSFGGGIAQWLLLDQRARVDRLGLIAAGGLGHEVGLGLRLASLPFPEFLCTPVAMGFGTFLGVMASRRIMGYPALPEIRELARMNAIRGTGRAFCRSVRGVIDVHGQSRQTRAGLGSVASLPPIALFWGENDHIIPMDHGRLALGMFPGATLKVFPGCGHFPHLQEPEGVAAEVLAFLGDKHRAPAHALQPFRSRSRLHGTAVAL